MIEWRRRREEKRWGDRAKHWQEESCRHSAGRRCEEAKHMASKKALRVASIDEMAQGALLSPERKQVDPEHST